MCFYFSKQLDFCQENREKRLNLVAIASKNHNILGDLGEAYFHLAQQPTIYSPLATTIKCPSNHPELYSKCT